MSTYSYHSTEDKKSSGTAKTALGIAIGGLSLAALQGGILGGNGDCCNGGGLLGNLFGNRNSAYCQEEKRLGEQARNEISILDKYLFPMMQKSATLDKEVAVNPLLMEREMVDKWILPLMSRTCNLEKEIAVNEAKDQKDQVIQQLMFQLVEQNTNAKFNALQSKTDAEFVLNRALTKAEIDAATCNVVRGTPYINPSQMADPYHGGMNYLLTRHLTTVPAVVQQSDCGCGGAWSNFQG